MLRKSRAGGPWTFAEAGCFSYGVAVMVNREAGTLDFRS